MSKQLINIVLDLETLSTQENAAIIQIGCCVPVFDRVHLPPFTPPDFEVTIAYEDALSAEIFHKSKETMEWWEQQDKITRMEVFSGQESYCTALDALQEWFKSVRQFGSDVAIFGNGPEFDNNILAYTISAMNYPDMWDFRNNHSMRTMKRLFPVAKLEHELALGERKHTALGDARFEARQLDMMYRNYQYLQGIL